MKKYKPVVLVVLDGLGIAQDKIGSPWEIAKHPTFSEMEKFYPFTTLQASGISVGLSWEQEGNSEIGHLAIGSGRIIYTYLSKILASIKDGSFFNNESFLKTIDHVRNSPTGESRIHITGLFSSGTVHAYYEHLYALLEFLKRNKIEEVFLHLFTDGRDAPVNESYKFFQKLEAHLQQEYPFAKIASVIGRRYAMDRDAKWDKIEKAYNLFTQSVGNQFRTASSYIKEQYDKSLTDECIEPGMLSNSHDSRIKDNDAVIFFNFREDSARELTHSFIDESFSAFNRKKLNNLLFITMTEYDKNLPVSLASVQQVNSINTTVLSAFKSADIKNPLAKIISDAGLKQLHVAETEKYAHVTYFFNGGEEKPFKNEDRIMFPSPTIESYEKKPEMSAFKIKDMLISKLANYNFVVVNFANADMVGHTGNIEATAKALEVLDSCLKEVVEKVLKLDGALIVTADHGNAEEKLYKLTGEKKTKHSINPVPFYLIIKEAKRNKPLDEGIIKEYYQITKGTLTDVAPTILELLGLEKPQEMDGKSLIDKLIKG